MADLRIPVTVMYYGLLDVTALLNLSTGYHILVGSDVMHIIHVVWNHHRMVPTIVRCICRHMVDTTLCFELRTQHIIMTSPSSMVTTEPPQ